MENNRIKQIKTFLLDTPDDPFLNYALAIEYLSLNEVENSKRIFELLIDKSPEYSATYYHYGKLLIAENKKEEAKLIFERGIEIANKNKELHAVAELRTILNELLYDED